jgi:glycosyltransferase involved in cell wall biosynthesis
MVAGRSRALQLGGACRGLWDSVAGRDRRQPASLEPGVLLIGHPFGILGVGENLRSTAAALDAAAIPFRIRGIHEASGGEAPLLDDFDLASRITSDLQPRRANVFCLNANEMDSALTYLGPEVFESSYNIGCWVWELSEFPKTWRRRFRYVDEIWAQSRFIQESISRDAPVPVIWVPQVIEPGPADPAVARELGVPQGTFSYLFFFDFTSFVARKNPLAVIDAFRLAFPDNSGGDACLVLKLNGMQHRPDEHRAFMKHLGSDDPRIVVIDRVLSGRQMKGLLAGCDAFVSLHRAEGFGRGVGEAMYYGKPVIATAYSGVTDFANASNSCPVDYRLVPVRKGEYPFWKGQQWADADVGHAAWWMRRLYDDRALCRSIGEAAARSIRATHGALPAGRLMRARLEHQGLL